MKRKQIHMTGALLAVVLMAGSVQAGVIVRDEFNTDSATPDYANGVYLSGADLIDSAGNATCSGGTIVGFDGSTAWSSPDSGIYYDAYANTMRLLHRTYGATYVGRQITSSVAGKTEAYARTSMRMRSTAASASAAYAYAGFGSNNSLGSDGGATIGFNWDSANSQWDLALRYNNGTTAVATNVLTNITVDSTYGLIWKMDDATDSISVWVNETDLSNPADLTVANWGGTISDITHLTAGFSETGASGDIYVYDMALGDTPQDVGAIPEPGTLSMFGIATLGALMVRRIRM